ncbi:VOC family protein [Streptomyces sp. AN091965]|uniref:VOC family protein n=1 Tax=Streptomyces sp. AN091965 TaxID=2927803 RepID=UPI001F6030DA|nr:VOC family protein [Streptomyces sp. AN091965]MCI3931162.1 VOC family protein [Streptomyces sp. AN091965]
MLSTDFVPGAPNWLDLGAPDTDAAAAFYAAAFGWEYESAGPEAGGYGFFRQDGRTVAGLGPLTEEGASSAWTVYFHTRDADATAKAVEEGGGTVRVAPSDVFGFGRLAQFTDPAGADFAVWQPADTNGVELVAEHNSLAWVELYTTNSAEAKAFYRAVFAWQTRDVRMSPELTYTVLTPAGGSEENSHGGLMQLPQENLDAGSTPEWHPYFEVADVDATLAGASAAGATVIIPAMDAEGIGRMAMFLDPAGAPFAVIKSAPAGHS